MILANYGTFDAAPGRGELEMSKPLLHLVFGGEVSDPQGLEFVDIEKLDIVGIYPSYAKALEAWRGASQARGSAPRRAKPYARSLPTSLNGPSGPTAVAC